MRRRKARPEQAVATAVPTGELKAAAHPAAAQEVSVSEDRSHSGEGSPGVPPIVPPSAGSAANDPGFKFKVPPILLEGDDPEPPVVRRPAPESTAAAEPQPSVSQLTPSPEPLPESYGTGRLLLAARDPHALFLHWDISAEQRRRINGVEVPRQLFVRLLPQERPTESATEIRVPPASRDWFIHAPNAATNYIAELGYYEPADQWRPIGTSNPARTPPETVAASTHFQFATVSFDAAPTAPQENPPAPGREPSRLAEISSPQHEKTPRAAVEALIRSAEFPPPGLAAADNPSAAVPQPSAPVLEMQETGGTTPNIPPTEPSSEWTPEKERELAELIGWVPLKTEWPGSAEIPQMVLGRPPVSAPVVSAAELIQPVSSPAGGERTLPQAFWLKVNAELIVYGATDPGARVTLGGQLIQLRPDGTFSLRVALPDGHFGLPIEARSALREIRQVRLDFARATTWQGETVIEPSPGLKNPDAGSST